MNSATIVLRDLRRREPGTATDGRDDQVQRGVLRVAALFLQVGGGFVFLADLDELRFVGVAFAEVGAEAALSVLNLHDDLLGQSSSEVLQQTFPEIK
jgi:hypothetical protein